MTLKFKPIQPVPKFRLIFQSLIVILLSIGMTLPVSAMQNSYQEQIHETRKQLFFNLAELNHLSGQIYLNNTDSLHFKQGDLVLNYTGEKITYQALRDAIINGYVENEKKEVVALAVYADVLVGTISTMLSQESSKLTNNSDLRHENSSLLKRSLNQEPQNASSETQAPALTFSDSQTAVYWDTNGIQNFIPYNITLTDADTTNFSGGKVTFAFGDGVVADREFLTFRGNHYNNYKSVGDTVFAPTLPIGQHIGTLDTEVSVPGAAVAVTLNHNATIEHLKSLIRNVYWGNTDPARALSGVRTMIVTVTDPEGNSGSAELDLLMESEPRTATLTAVAGQQGAELGISNFSELTAATLFSFEIDKGTIQTEALHEPSLNFREMKFRVTGNLDPGLLNFRILGGDDVYKTVYFNDSYEDSFENGVLTLRKNSIILGQFFRRDTYRLIAWFKESPPASLKEQTIQLSIDADEDIGFDYTSFPRARFAPGDVVSSPISTVVAEPGSLKFEQAPKVTLSGHVSATPFVVYALDDTGNLDTDFNEDISLSLPGGSLATLSGTRTVRAVQGVAIFNNIVLSTNTTGVHTITLEANTTEFSGNYQTATILQSDTGIVPVLYVTDGRNVFGNTEVQQPFSAGVGFSDADSEYFAGGSFELSIIAGGVDGEDYITLGNEDYYTNARVEDNGAVIVYGDSIGVLANTNGPSTNSLKISFNENATSRHLAGLIFSILYGNNNPDNPSYGTRRVRLTFFDGTSRPVDVEYDFHVIANDKDGVFRIISDSAQNTFPTSSDSFHETTELLSFEVSQPDSGNNQYMDIRSIKFKLDGTIDPARVSFKLNRLSPSPSGLNITYNEETREIIHSSSSTTVVPGTPVRFSLAAYFNNAYGVNEGETLQVSLDPNTDIEYRNYGYLVSDEIQEYPLQSSAEFSVDIVGTKVAMENNFPTEIVAGELLEPQPVISITDEYGNVDTDFNGDIELTATNYWNQGQSYLINGSSVISAVQGRAAFAGLSVSEFPDSSAIRLQIDATGSTNITGISSSSISGSLPSSFPIVRLSVDGFSDLALNWTLMSASDETSADIIATLYDENGAEYVTDKDMIVPLNASHGSSVEGQDYRFPQGKNIKISAGSSKGSVPVKSMVTASDSSPFSRSYVLVQIQKEEFTQARLRDYRAVQLEFWSDVPPSVQNLPEAFLTYEDTAMPLDFAGTAIIDDDEQSVQLRFIVSGGGLTSPLLTENPLSGVSVSQVTEQRLFFDGTPTALNQLFSRPDFLLYTPDAEFVGDVNFSVGVFNSSWGVQRNINIEVQSLNDVPVVSLVPENELIFTEIDVIDGKTESLPFRNPWETEISPDGEQLYVLSQFDGISTYEINNTGQLNQLAHTELARDGLSGTTTNMLLSPDGRHIYVIHHTPVSVATYEVNEHSGELTYLEHHVLNNRAADDATEDEMVMTSDGRHLYITQFDGPGVVAFNRDPTTGRLTLTQQTEEFHLLDNLTITPDENFVYVSDVYRGPVRTYERHSDTGELSLIQESVVANESVATLEVSPDGRHLYGVGYLRDIVVWDINQASGLLSNKRVQTLSHDVSILEFDKDSGLIYGANSLSEVIYVYSRDVNTGELSLIGEGATGIESRDRTRNISDLTSLENSDLVYVSFYGTDNVKGFRVRVQEPLTYREDAVPVALFEAAEINDADHAQLQSLTLQVSNNFHGERLGYGQLPTNITTTGFNSVNGTLEFVGPASHEDFETVLRSITYSFTDQNPSTEAQIAILANDGEGESELLVDVTVVPVNDAPSISGTPAVSTSHNEAYTFVPTVTDPDDTALQFTVENLPRWLNLDSTSGVLTGVPGASNIRVFSDIVMTVSDGEASVTLPAFDIEVIRKNNPPIIDQGSSITLTLQEDGWVELQLSATDEIVGSLSWKVVKGARNGYVSTKGITTPILRYKAKSNFYGEDSVRVSVSDGYLTDEIVVQYIVNPVNDAPEISGVPEATVTEGELYLFKPASKDIDGDTMKFSADNLPEWLNLDTSSGIISGTPVAEHSGIHANITIQVSDGELSASLDEFAIEVIALNKAPEAINMSLDTDEEQVLQIVPEIVDEVPESVILELVKDVDHGTLTAVGDGWEYLPDQDFVGGDSFIYKASDGEFSSANATVSIQVNNINDSPRAIDDDFNVEQNVTFVYELDVLANDVDADIGVSNDSLSIASVTAEFGAATIEDNLIHFLPGGQISGSFLLQYTVSDSEGELDTAEVRVTIAPGVESPPPVITAPENLTVDATGLLTIVPLGSATAMDENGEPLQVTLLREGNAFVPGTHRVFWQAENSAGMSAVAEQIVKVNPLVNIDSASVITEGDTLTLRFVLNGEAPDYPFDVSYSVSGNADNTDHDLVAGALRIESGRSGELEVVTYLDKVEEGAETLVVELDESINRDGEGVKTINIVETPVSPVVSLKARQSEQWRTAISQAEGYFQVIPEIVYADESAHLTFDWTFGDLLPVMHSDDSITFDPSQISPGVYEIGVTVTVTENPSLTATAGAYIVINDTLETMGDGDTDGDLLSDKIEGYQDSDGDGIADYVDAISQCNVMPVTGANQLAYLIQSDSDVCLRQGKLSVGDSTHGLSLSDAAIQQLPTDMERQRVDKLLDFSVYGLNQVGSSIRLVIPLSSAAPEGAIYRKYNEIHGWYDFVLDERNKVYSTQGAPGVCPSPAAEVWVESIETGAWCLLLQLEDGGPNDDDGIANGAIADPGGLTIATTHNTVPDIVDDVATMLWNGSIEIDVLANDRDADGDVLEVIAASSQIGKVEILRSGQLLYLAADNYLGTDELTYTVSDGQGGISTARVVVNIRRNQAPVAVDDKIQMIPNQTIVVDVLDNDYDPDGDALEISTFFSEFGNVELKEGGLVYQAPGTFKGPDRVTYVVTDQYGATDVGVLIIDVDSTEGQVQH